MGHRVFLFLRVSFLSASFSLASLIPGSAFGATDAMPSRHEDGPRPKIRTPGAGRVMNGVLLRISACPGVDPRRFRRILGMELGDALNRGPETKPFQVGLTCRDGAMTISVRDPVTRKFVTRTVPWRTAPKPGASRDAALATSQLFIASWLELLTAKGRAQVRPSEKQVAQVAATVVSRHVPVRGRPLGGNRTPPPRQIGLDLKTGLVLRDLAQPLPMAALAVQADILLGRDWNVGVYGMGQFGRAVRDIGTVDALLAGAGLSGGWTWLRRGRWSFRTDLDLAVAYARLMGHPTADEASGHVSQSLVGDAGASLGARLRLGPVTLGLDLSAGGSFPLMRGQVTGEPSVDLSGPWVGLAIGLQTAPTGF